MPKAFPRDVRERAVRLVRETKDQYESEWSAITSIGAKLGVSGETLRKWVRQAQIDAGETSGVTTNETAQIKALKREVAELKRANEILKTAASFFAAELDRPHQRS